MTEANLSLLDEPYPRWAEHNQYGPQYLAGFPPTPPLTGMNESKELQLQPLQHQQQQLQPPQQHMFGTEGVNDSSPQTPARRHSHRSHRKSDELRGGAGLSRSASRKASKLIVNTELYKTELCASFIKSGGNCPYGDKCQFAHGEHDLKVVDRPPKWRSKACQNWIKTGTCAYNERCCFRHDGN